MHDTPPQLSTAAKSNLKSPQCAFTLPFFGTAQRARMAREVRCAMGAMGAMSAMGAMVAMLRSIVQPDSMASPCLDHPHIRHQL